MWLTSTQLWVADRNAGRFAVFNRSALETAPPPLAFIEGHTQLNENQQGGSSDDFRRPRSMALDTANNLFFVADTDNHRVPIFGPIPSNMNDPSG